MNIDIILTNRKALLFEREWKIHENTISNYIGYKILSEKE